MKTLILLSASPASGKTTWAKHYLEEHPNTYYISSDELRIEITGGYNDFSKQNVVWETYEERLKAFSKKEGDFTLILDALNDLNVLRRKYASVATGFDKKVLVVIKKSLEETLKNNSTRPDETRVPDDVMVALYNKFELPDEETLKCFDEYIYIDKRF